MADTRERIITATNELFRRHGYNGTSLSQISAASDATTGSIYHFFPGGKEALTAAVIDSTGEVYRQLFEAVADEADDPVSAFTDMFTAAAAVLVETDYLDPCPIGTIAREVASTNDELRRRAEAAFDGWTEAAVVRLRAAGIEEEAALDLGTMFVAAIEGGFVLSRTKRSPEPMLAAARTIAPLIRAALEESVRRPG